VPTNFSRCIRNINLIDITFFEYLSKYISLSNKCSLNNNLNDIFLKELKGINFKSQDSIKFLLSLETFI